jgi:hypothetical protein
MLRLLTFLFAFVLALPAQAALPTRLGDELSVGDAPAATTVLPGDRVIAVLIGATSRSIAWRDAADYTVEAAVVSTSIDARALAAGGTAEAPVLIVAGSGLETIPFDTLEVPASTGSSSTIELDGDKPGSLVAVAWSSDHNVAYAVNDEVPALHAFDLEAGAQLTPVSLSFTPTGVAVLASDLVVVVGVEDGAPRMVGIALDTSGVLGEVGDVDLTELFSGTIDAIVTDGVGVGWLIASNGDDKQLIEIIREDVGVRSAPRGCSVVDGDSGGFLFFTLNCDLPQAATTAAYGVGVDDDEDVPFVYIGGGGVVQRVDVDIASELELETLGITPVGTTGDLALSSKDDGYLYVAEPGTGLLGVVVPGPWLVVETSDTTLSGNADTLTFSITAALNALSSCTFTVHQGGDFTGTGAAVDGAAGLVTEGAPTEVSISALDLEDGSARLFILCADDRGAFGRASFTYYEGSLDAPEISALPGNEKVTISFDGLEEGTIEKYFIHFDTRNFGATGDASGTTASGAVTSPIEIDADSGVASGDDDDATDDDDDDEETEERESHADTLSYTYELADLLNETVYYFAVSAVDSDGNEGPRSDIVEARPGVTGGAAALAGDTYGCTCQNVDPGSGVPVGLSAALIALLGLGRMRRSGVRDSTRS